jgi:hypothetical protein
MAWAAKSAVPRRKRRKHQIVNSWRGNKLTLRGAGICVDTGSKLAMSKFGDRDRQRIIDGSHGRIIDQSPLRTVN